MSSITTSQLYETNDQRQWHLSILVLAAGRSSRLGCNKQLVSIDSKPLLTRCFDNLKGLQQQLQQSNDNPVFSSKLYCVTGFDEQRLQDSISFAGVSTITNTDWASGLGSSIACGLNAVVDELKVERFSSHEPPNRDCSGQRVMSTNKGSNKINGCLLVLADQWRLTQQSLYDFVMRWSEQSDYIFASEYSRDVGPPVIFPEQYYSELQALSGDRGARSILKRHAPRVIKQPYPEAEYDLDKPEDLQQINQYQAKQGTAL